MLLWLNNLSQLPCLDELQGATIEREINHLSPALRCPDPFTQGFACRPVDRPGAQLTLTIVWQCAKVNDPSVTF